MLLPLDYQTPKCRVFDLLNRELLYFLEKAVDAGGFGRWLFSEEIGIACWENPPTRQKFEGLWRELELLPLAERNIVLRRIATSQNLPDYFAQRQLCLPVLHPNLLKAIKDLTCHLFSRTRDLAEIKRSAGESVGEHYRKFRGLNGNNCPVCATELLSQRRPDIGEDDQWRADYDHLLCKDKYPIYAVHPFNLLPTCHTCNSKAKGAKELLTVPGEEVRRLAFYPYSQNCSRMLMVSLDEGDPDAVFKLAVSHRIAGADDQERLRVWEEVYQVPCRVEAELASFDIWLNTDCRPKSYDHFCEQVADRARPTEEWKTRPWQFWRLRLYQWLNEQEESIKRAVWNMVNARRQRDEDSSRELYGI